VTLFDFNAITIQKKLCNHLFLLSFLKHYQ